MANYKTRWFDCWARKQGLATSSLCTAVREMEAGLIDADLGSGLVKTRIRRARQVKSGGFRTLVATNKGNRWVFVLGFLEKLAAHLLSFTPQAISNAERVEELIEVDCDAEDEVSHSRKAVHETAKGLHKAGVMDQVTLREFDQLALPTVEPLAPAQIKRIRENSHVSQAIFARLRNTSLSTVQKWKIRQKKPTGAAVKLLHLVQKCGLDAVAG